MTTTLFLDTRAAAKACSVSTTTILRAVRAGELRARRQPGRARNAKLLFDPADLRKWVEWWDEA